MIAYKVKRWIDLVAGEVRLRRPWLPPGENTRRANDNNISETPSRRVARGWT